MFRITVCHRLIVCTAAWAIAVALAVVHSFTVNERLMPWLLVFLVLASVSSASLMLWMARETTIRELRAAYLAQHGADSNVSSIGL